MKTIVKIGRQAYLDTLFGGLIPVVVRGYSPDGEIIVTVTADHMGYRKEETFPARPIAVVPRSHVRTRALGKKFIVGSWEFDGLAAEFQPKFCEGK